MAPLNHVIGVRIPASQPDNSFLINWLQARSESTRRPFDPILDRNLTKSRALWGGELACYATAASWQASAPSRARSTKETTINANDHDARHMQTMRNQWNPRRTQKTPRGVLGTDARRLPRWEASPRGRPRVADRSSRPPESLLVVAWRGARRQAERSRRVAAGHLA